MRTPGKTENTISDFSIFQFLLGEIQGKHRIAAPKIWQNYTSLRFKTEVLLFWSKSQKNITKKSALLGSFGLFVFCQEK